MVARSCIGEVKSDHARLKISMMKALRVWTLVDSLVIEVRSLTHRCTTCNIQQAGTSNEVFHSKDSKDAST